MSGGSRRQRIDLRVSLAGEQQIGIQVHDPAATGAVLGVQVGNLELRFTDAAAARDAAGWWQSTLAMSTRLPWEIGPIGIVRPVTTPRVAVTIDNADAAAAMAGFVDVEGDRVLRGVIGQLTLEVCDRHAYESMSVALGAARITARTLPEPGRASATRNRTRAARRDTAPTTAIPTRSGTSRDRRH